MCPPFFFLNPTRMSTPSATSLQRANADIQSGFAAQQAGDAAGASAAYQRALKWVPEHPTALQLLGLLAKQRGDLVEAEDLMRRSLTVFPRQVHVWNNLGNVLETRGLLNEALQAYAQALAQDEHYADAWLNRGALLLRTGLLDDALLSAQRALQADAQAAHTAAHARPSIWLLIAQIQGAQGLLEDACTTLQQGLAQHPEHGPLHHNLGVLLHRLQRPAQALQAHDKALALGVQAADAHYNRGNTLQSLGRMNEALDAYRGALKQEPAHALSLYDLARLRWRMRDAQWDAELVQALSLDSSGALHEMYAQMLWRGGLFEEARQRYEQALKLSPQESRFLDGLARCEVRMGRAAQGLALHHKALELSPQDPALQASLATSLMLEQQAQEALPHAEAACRASPLDQYAWALLGLVWKALGDPREAWLNDYERWVKVVDLPPPTGFASMAEFNIALAEELHQAHHDKQAPLDQTLRGGTQTLGDLFDQGRPLVNQLKRRIEEAVQAYIESLPSDDQHPLLSRRTVSWRFSDSWSSQLHDEGRHTHHVHPHGWISSAYYVSVPQVCADEQQKQGWIQFGLPDEAMPQFEHPALQIQPQPGRLVLFPSYFWHGTTPFHSANNNAGDREEKRLTIAFDVVPT